jgi:ribose transport system permease protein
MAYAVGGNAEASRLSGLPVKFVSASTYVFLGACCGMAGFINASQLSSAQSTVDSSILFDVATIVVLGGNSFGGGSGSIWQTLVGLIMIASIGNGFVMLNINPFYQSLCKGIIIVAALIVNSLFKGTTERSPQSRM